MRALPAGITFAIGQEQFACADLYEFDVGGLTYRFTNCDVDLTGIAPAEVETYTSMNIDRERIRAASGLEVDDLSVEVAHDSTTMLGIETWAAVARGTTLDEAPFRVYRAYLNPSNWTVAGCYLRFSGYVSSTDTGSTTIRIVAVVSADSFGLAFPGVTYEQRCVWDLGGRGCEYAAGTGNTYSVTGNINSSARQLTIDEPLPGGEALETFRHGTIEHNAVTKEIIAVWKWQYYGVGTIYYTFDVASAFAATMNGATVDLTSKAISYTVTPESSSTSSRMELTTPPEAAGNFIGGTITVDGISRTIVSVDLVTHYFFNVAPAFPFTLAGIGVVALAKGCDKTAAACDATFLNLSHHMAAPRSPSGIKLLDWPGIPTKESSGDKKHQLYGRSVQVVYGTATVTAALLMGVWKMWVDGETKMDGVHVDSPAITLGRVQFGLAWGPITSVEGIIYYKYLYNPGACAVGEVEATYLGSLDSPGYPPTFTLGDVTTSSEWSILSALDADNRVEFGHLAIMRCERFACPGSKDFFDADSGTTLEGPIVPTELKAVIRGTTGAHRNTAREAVSGDRWIIYDAHPADVITDLIENSFYGLAFPAGTVQVDLGGDGTAGSSYRNFCDAYGLYISLGVDRTLSVAEVIRQILTATNSVGFWDGAQFKVLPLGDETATGNSVTYTPALVALSINDDHLNLDGENPVLIRRAPLVDAFNVCPVEWTRDTMNRDVETITSSSMDVADVTVRRPRTAPPVSLPCVRSEAHALLASAWLANASVYSRDTYEFTVFPNASAKIQVGDVLALTHVASGIDDFLIRVTETDEDARGQLKITAKNWNTGAVYTRVAMANPIYDLVAYVHDAPAGASNLGRWAIARTIAFPANFSGSSVSAGVAATASTVLTVKKNGTSVGTLTFAISGTVPTMSGSAWSVVAGDIVTVENQATADASLAKISITLAGERTV